MECRVWWEYNCIRCTTSMPIRLKVLLYWCTILIPMAEKRKIKLCASIKYLGFQAFFLLGFFLILLFVKIHDFAYRRVWFSVDLHKKVTMSTKMKYNQNKLASLLSFKVDNSSTFRENTRKEVLLECPSSDIHQPSTSHIASKGKGRKENLHEG